MCALIMQNVHAPVGPAYDHHRFAAEIGAEVIARLFDLTLVTDIKPSGPEDAFELQLENRRIGIETTVNASRPDQRTNVFDYAVQHRRTSCQRRPTAALAKPWSVKD